jgi:hypothetical protein
MPALLHLKYLLCDFRAHLLRGLNSIENGCAHGSSALRGSTGKV